MEKQLKKLTNQARNSLFFVMTPLISIRPKKIKNKCFYSFFWYALKGLDMSLRFCTKATLLLEGYFKLLDERCQVYIWNHLRLNWKLKLIFLSNNNFYLINLVSNKNYFFLLFYKKSVSFNSGSNYYFKCPYQSNSVSNYFRN